MECCFVWQAEELARRLEARFISSPAGDKYSTIGREVYNLKALVGLQLIYSEWKGGRRMEEKKFSNVSYEIRVSKGREGSDPNAPDWEVCELEDGEVKDSADIYDNLTLGEAEQIAGMWTRKKEEAEAES
jgi:hypothetical protein